MNIDTGYGSFNLLFKGINDTTEMKAQELLTALLKKVIKKAGKYACQVDDSIFAYSEKQLNTVFCPALGSINCNFIAEYPLKRTHKVKEKEFTLTGFLDYWISYKKCSFLLELKQGFFSLRDDVDAELLRSNFKVAIKQLNDIGLNERKELQSNDKELIGIALEVVTFYQSLKDKNTIDSQGIKEKYNDLRQKFKDDTEIDALNLESIWYPKEELVKDIKYSGNSFVIPAVAFLGKIVK